MNARRWDRAEIVLELAGARVPLTSHECHALRTAVARMLDAVSVSLEDPSIPEYERHDLKFRAASLSRLRRILRTGRFPNGPLEINSWRRAVLASLDSKTNPGRDESPR